MTEMTKNNIKYMKMNGNSFILHGNGPQIYEQFASNMIIDHRSIGMLLATCP